MGEKIIFGNEIILMHLDSELFLCSSTSCSDSTTDGYKLKMKQRLTSAEIFKIMPANNYEKIGDDVYLDNPIVLINQKTKCYLEFSLNKIFTLDKIIQKQEKY